LYAKGIGKIINSVNVTITDGTNSLTSTGTYKAFSGDKTSEATGTYTISKYIVVSSSN